MNDNEVRNIVEASLMVAQRPLTMDSLLGLFGEAGRPERGQIRDALEGLRESYEGRGIELVEVASGYRIQVRQQLSEWVSRLWQERPPRYSRALLETLSLIAYRQPITRGEIEDIRGVSVSTNIMRTLLDRGWVRVLGTRDVPGKPAMFGTTREFLDYFGLKRLDDLPSLAELRDIDSINVELDLPSPDDVPLGPTDAGSAELGDTESALEELADNDADADGHTGSAVADDSDDVEPADERGDERGGSNAESGDPAAQSEPGPDSREAEADQSAGTQGDAGLESASDLGETKSDQDAAAAVEETEADDSRVPGAAASEASDEPDADEADRAAVADLPVSR